MHKVMTLMLIAGLLVACAPTVVNPPLDLAERFRLVVFQDETRQSKRLYRWEDGPLLVSVVGAEPWQLELVKEHTALLGNVLGIDASVLSEGGEKPNMEILFDTPDRLRVWARTASLIYGDGNSRNAREWAERSATSCFGYLDRRAEQFLDWVEPHAGNIFISSVAPESLVRQCVVQEMTQALGPAGDTDWRTDTAFSNTGADHLTATDRALLAILYDDRLTVGMTWDEAQPIVQAIIQERYPDGP